MIALHPDLVIASTYTPPATQAAYARADQDPDFTSTDDCSVVLRYLPEVPVHVVPGDERNLKVTTPADIQLAGSFLRMGGQEPGG